MEEAVLRSDKEFVTGEGFRYLGWSRLKLVDEAPVPAGLVHGRLLWRRDCLGRAQDELIAWFRGGGNVWLPAHLDRFGAQLWLPESVNSAE